MVRRRRRLQEKRRGSVGIGGRGIGGADAPTRGVLRRSVSAVRHLDRPNRTTRRSKAKTEEAENRRRRSAVEQSMCQAHTALARIQPFGCRRRGVIIIIIRRRTGKEPIGRIIRLATRALFTKRPERQREKERDAEREREGGREVITVIVIPSRSFKRQHWHMPLSRGKKTGWS